MTINFSEMRLGKKFTELTIKRILIVFFLIVYSIPFVIDTTYVDAVDRYTPFLKTVRHFHYSVSVSHTDLETKEIFIKAM